MAAWFSQNWGSIVAAVIIAAILALIIWKLVRDRKKGKRGCGGSSCAGCPGCDVNCFDQNRAYLPTMRKIQFEIDQVKSEITLLKGRDIRMYINKGRKRIITLSGRVVDVYPSVFTVRIEGSKSLDIQSFSFSDVLTGDVRVAAAGAGEEFAPKLADGEEA